MGSKGYIFDRRHGQLLEEIDAEFECTWTISGVDDCKFSFPGADIKNTEQLFEFGNWLCVLNGEGLPPWVGRFEPTRSSGMKLFKHTALSAPNIFNQRIGTYQLPYGLRDTAGAIFRELIRIANSEEDTLIRPNEIFMGGKRCGTTISPATNLMFNLDQLIKQTGYEYSIDPTIVNNRLTLQGNWYERKGAALDRGLNENNCQMDSDPLEETGPIFNVILGLGPESTGQVRTHHLARDQASIDRYGARATRFNSPSGEGVAVMELTEAELRRLAWPRRVFKGTASSADNTYFLLRLGNILTFDNSKIGYGPRGGLGTQAYVRLMGMSHRDGSDGATLTLKEYIP